MSYAWFANLRLGKAARMALKGLARGRRVRIGQVVGDALTEWYDGDRKTPKVRFSYVREIQFQVLISIDDDREEYEYFLSDFHKQYGLNKIELYSAIVYSYLCKYSEDFKKRSDTIDRDFKRIEDGDVKFLNTAAGRDTVVLYGRMKEKERVRKKLMANRRKRNKREKAQL